METNGDVRATRVVRPASMGPWPFSHGNRRFQWMSSMFGLNASMGPWPFSHGNHTRDFLLRAKTTRLQWGHGLSAMETRGSRARHASPTGFNGAMAFQTWKRARR